MPLSLYLSFCKSLSRSLSSSDDKLSENIWFVWSRTSYLIPMLPSHPQADFRSEQTCCFELPKVFQIESPNHTKPKMKSGCEQSCKITSFIFNTASHPCCRQDIWPPNPHISLPQHTGHCSYILLTLGSHTWRTIYAIYPHAKQTNDNLWKYSRFRRWPSLTFCILAC